jgi:adenylate cyclase
MTTGDHTFLFADLAGFTALTEAHGDEDSADLAGEFFALVGKLAAAHRADVIKTIGDAVMLRADSAHDAVTLAVRIVNEVGAQHGFPSIRVGLHTGPAAERSGDWFGATVNTAARVAALASGGQVLLSDATRQASGPVEHLDFHERGRHELKNVTEPVTIYAAHVAPPQAAASLPIDPVCRMAIEPRHAAGQLIHDGVKYEFCSLRCAHAFAAAPDRYAAATP